MASSNLDRSSVPSILEDPEEDRRESGDDEDEPFAAARHWKHAFDVRSRFLSSRVEPGRVVDGIGGAPRHRFGDGAVAAVDFDERLDDAAPIGEE